MSQQDVLGFVDLRRQSGRPAMVWMKLLHQRPVGANDFLGARALRQAQDLIRLVARHRPAASRPAAAPRPHPRLPDANRQTGGRDTSPVDAPLPGRRAGNPHRAPGIRRASASRGRAPAAGRRAPCRSPLRYPGRAASRSSPNAPSRPGPAAVPKPAAPKTEASRPPRPNNPRLAATAASVAAPAKLPRSNRNAATTKTATAPPLRTAAAADAGLSRANLRIAQEQQIEGENSGDECRHGGIGLPTRRRADVSCHASRICSSRARAQPSPLRLRASAVRPPAA